MLAINGLSKRALNIFLIIVHPVLAHLVKFGRFKVSGKSLFSVYCVSTSDSTI